MNREVVYQERGFDVVITVREAKAIDGYKRQILLTEAIGIERGPDQSVLEIALDVFRLWTYPAVAAATISIKNNPDAVEKVPENVEKLTLAILIDLPDTLVSRWESMVFELNPHWVPVAPGKDEETKKEEAEVAIT